MMLQGVWQWYLLWPSTCGFGTVHIEAIIGTEPIAGALKNPEVVIRGCTEYIRQAHKGDANLAYAHYNRGLAYHNKKDLESAIRDYSEAIRLDPTHFKAYHNRGNVYYAKKDYDRAFTDYGLSIRHNPAHDERTYMGRRNAGLHKREFDRAMANFDQAIRLNPKDADTYVARAKRYFEYGRAVDGLPDVERALELQPNLAAALHTRGQIYEALGRREHAIADFRKVLELHPTGEQSQESREGLKRLGVER
jgi:tetratricopeptide (TPR) repeat protein